MKLDRIINFLERSFPKFIAEEWDNVGLLIGNRDTEVKKVMLALDLTDDVIERAIESGVNLIITHHPPIFNSIKSITTDTVLGRKIFKVVQNNINIYTLHTNIDLALNGLNDYIGNYIFPNVKSKVIVPDKKKEVEFGLGRVYNLEESITISNLIIQLKNKLSLKDIISNTTQTDKKIKNIAFINGSASNYWKMAKSVGADILVTGDVKYHEAFDAKEAEFPIIDIGHYESEINFLNMLNEILKEKFEIEIEQYSGSPIFHII